MTSYAYQRSDAPREGFTLVELLVVIAIIGILSSAALVAVVAARKFVSGATARVRLDDIAQAVEMYKQKYGEYPPDCTATDAEIRSHVLKRWKNALKSGVFNRKDADGNVLMFKIVRDNYAKGDGYPLLFWLAGPDGEGFGLDDADPFCIDPDGPREEPMIELTYDSDPDGSGGGNYNDEGFMYKGMPIVYFRAHAKSGYDGKDYHSHGRGEAAPYMNGGVWYNSDSFQLILPGEDGLFGDDPYGDDEHHGDYVARDLKDSSTFTTADRDNITNFSNGATIGDDIE